MFKIDLNTTPEELRAQFEAMSPEDKKAIVTMIVSGVNRLVFDVLAVDAVAKSNGNELPTEPDFAQALMNENASQRMH